jgi:hypothetical protein
MKAEVDVVLPAGDEPARVEFRPDARGTPRYLEIDARDADSVLLVGALVDGRSQWPPGGGPIPGLALVEGALGARLAWDEVRPDRPANLLFKNVAGAPARLRARLHDGASDVEDEERAVAEWRATLPLRPLPRGLPQAFAEMMFRFGWRAGRASRP